MEASDPLPIFLLGSLAFPKNELTLYSEYTNDGNRSIMCAAKRKYDTMEKS